MARTVGLRIGQQPGPKVLAPQPDVMAAQYGVTCGAWTGPLAPTSNPRAVATIGEGQEVRP